MIYFQDVPGVGNLYWNELLRGLEDKDLIFTCKDDDDVLYYCICDDFLYENCSWLITPSAQEQIQKIKDREITLLTPFKEAEHVLVVDLVGVNTDYPEYRYLWTKYSDIDPMELPHSDQYLL